MTIFLLNEISISPNVVSDCLPHPEVVSLAMGNQRYQVSMFSWPVVPVFRGCQGGLSRYGQDLLLTR